MKLSHFRFITLSLIMLVFYIWLASNIPYTHDDWDWGLQEGLNHLFTADINNRFSGNLIEVILTRNIMLKTVFMGFVLTLIPFTSTLFVTKITKIKGNVDSIHALTFGFANAILLLMPVEVWQQTYGWVAGFSNFVVSGLGLVLLFYFISSLSSGKQTKINFFKITAVFIFGFAIQLFLENLTLYFFVFSIFLLIFSRTNKNIYKYTIPLSAGIFIGLIVMFLNKIYLSLFNSGSAIEDYRQIMYDSSQPISISIKNCIYRFFVKFIPQIFFYNGILMGLIAVFMAFLAVNRLKNKMSGYILCFANSIFGIYYMFTGIVGKFLTPVAFIQNIILDCTFIILVIVDIFIIFNNSKNIKHWLLSLFVSPLIIISPMVLINTVGPRSFYITLLCHVIFAMVLLEIILSETKHKTAIGLAAVTGVTLLVVLAHLIYIYIPIGNEMKKRNQMIETAISDNWDTIVFSEYPNSEYLWRPDPGKEDKVRWFREFYHIPKDKKLFFESWRKYMKKDSAA